MIKRVFVFLLLISLYLNLYAQESAKNTINIGISTPVGGMISGGGGDFENILYELFFRFYPSFWGIGLNIEYERMLNDKHSLSIDFGTDPMVFPYPILYTEIKYRWYPMSEVFFAGLGVGIWDLTSTPSLLISPAIGWKFVLGNKNRWVIMPNISGRYIINQNVSSYWDTTRVLKISFNVGYYF